MTITLKPEEIVNQLGEQEQGRGAVRSGAFGVRVTASEDLSDIASPVQRIASSSVPSIDRLTLVTALVELCLVERDGKRAQRDIGHPKSTPWSAVRSRDRR